MVREEGSGISIHGQQQFRRVAARLDQGGGPLLSCSAWSLHSWHGQAETGKACQPKGQWQSGFRAEKPGLH
jgi:hypothetical protein